MFRSATFTDKDLSVWLLADGSYNDQSDYDFYIVVNDEANPQETRRMARKAIRYLQKRPVDIVVGTNA